MNGITGKDVIRFMLVELFASVGFDPEVVLFRIQATIAFMGAPPFGTFF